MKPIQNPNHTTRFSGSVKMIFSDIDGTLCDFTRKVNPIVTQAVQKTIQLGIPFAFATGRVYPSVLPLIKQLELVHPQIASNGAEIIDPNSNEHIFHETLDPNTQAYLLDICNQYNFAHVVCSGNRLLATRWKPEFQIFEESGQATAIVDQQMLKSSPGEKIAVVVLQSQTQELQEFANTLAQIKHPKGIAFKQLVSEPTIMDLGPETTSKFNAIKLLCQRNGCTLDQVMAIGDGNNDAEMLRGVGCGVAMANAAQSALDAANFIAPDVSENGIVKALEFAWKHP